MSTLMIIRGSLPLRRRGSAPEPVATPTTQATEACARRIPRIARLMALARHIEALVRSGTVGSYAAAARPPGILAPAGGLVRPEMMMPS